MEPTILVRDVRPHELHMAAAKTGDTLPDGSVLLRRDDMDRMGLVALRDWIMTQARARSVIAIADPPPSPGRNGATDID